MTYKFDIRYIGYPPIEERVAVPLSLRDLPITSGTFATAEDPVWGPGEFVFARAGAGIRQYGACTLLPVWDSTLGTYTLNATEVPNTTLLGRPAYVSQCDGALLVGQYGWFQRSGIVPVNSTASVAVDTTTGIVAAGQLGAVAAGKQLVSARVVTPATQTVVKAGAGTSGDNRIVFQNVDGFIVGGYMSGTGVGASAIITAIDRINNAITVSVVNSAAIAGNSTCTYNNATIFYNVVAMERSFYQGQIT